MSYLLAGMLFGFAAAYLTHMPLTLGRIAVLVGFGIVVLISRLKRRVSKP